MIKFWDATKDYTRYGEGYDNEILKAVERVLLSGQLVLGYGEEVTNLEKSFAKYVGTDHAIMCGAGTHALYLAYRGLGIGPGDEVIVPSMTFAATFDQIIALGATPVFVDVGDDGLIDPNEVEKAITPKTKAIVPVHLEGKVCDMDKIMSLAIDHKLKVIEDSAQALGAYFINDHIAYKAGALGNAGCYSLFPAKVLGSGGNAGMITTNDDELAQKLRMLRCNYNLGKNPDLDAEYGVNMEPDNIQAAILNVKFKDHEGNLKRRAEVAKMYDEGIKGPKLAVQQEGRIYQDYVIRVAERKEELVKHLQEAGIGILGHNLIPHHCYAKLGVPFLPKTDEYTRQQIRIPCSANHTDEEIRYVIDVINKFYAKD